MSFFRGGSIGFLGAFGRSPDLRQLDDAFRKVDVHPKMMPEAVKLATVAILREAASGASPGPGAFTAAAEIVGYCLIGAEAFAGANTAGLTEAVESRIDAALASGSSLDAQLVLLALHAGIVQPGVREAFALESVTD